LKKIYGKKKMDNYKIKRNPKPLTDDQINRHKDFDKLLSNHQKVHRYKDATKPLYKNIGFMSMIALVGIVVLMLLLDHKEKEQKTTSDSLAVMKADTGMPMIQKEANIPEYTEKRTMSINNRDSISVRENNKTVEYEIFKINSEKGAVLYAKSGERFLIPVFAFADKAGNITKREVTLRYRPFSSVEEAGLKNDKNIKPSLLFEMISEESSAKTPVTLIQPIEMEAITMLREETGEIYNYANQKKSWVPSGKEKVAYRFIVQANKSEFPELNALQGLAWELPQEAGKPADFGYIFNRPWKSFSFKTKDKKELLVKNTNTSFKSVPDIISMLGDPKEDKKLGEAFYLLYNYATGKSTDAEGQKQAAVTVENWRNSPDGKHYIEWLKNKTAKNQFYTDKRTSKMLIKSLGYICLAYTSQKTNSVKVAKRILLLEKYPEKNQQFSNDLLEKEPSLRR
jgi:hypothetical protein